MTANRCYGNWTTLVHPYNLTLETEVAQALDTYEPTDEQLDAICAAYRDAINDALPTGMTLAGNEFYGPADMEAAADTVINLVLDKVDFWAVVEPILDPPVPGPGWCLNSIAGI